MKTHRFGSTNITVSELCFATSSFGRDATQNDAFTLLDAYRAAGGNFIETTCGGVDTSAGRDCEARNERFLNWWLDSRGVARAEIVIATRLDLRRAGDDIDVTAAEHALGAVRSSLRRIGSDHLDFLVLEWSEGLLPLRHSLAGLEAIVNSGTARHVILSGFPTEHLEPARSCLPCAIAGLQLDYSLVYRTAFDRGPSQFCREHGMGFVARSPLAGGHLVAWPAPILGSFPWRTAGDAFIASAAHAAWPLLMRMARAHDCRPATIALAWLLAQPGISSVRINTRSAGQLEELIAATQLRLSTAELEALGRQEGNSPTASAPPCKEDTDVVATMQTHDAEPSGPSSRCSIPDLYAASAPAERSLT